MDIILASSSPRRRDLLGQINLKFNVVVPDVEEIHRAGELPESYALRNAKDKALAVADLKADALVIAADTIVVLGNKILEKPRDERHAAEMLASLAGNTHQVITGLCLCKGDQLVVEPVSTDVTFKPLSNDEIAHYIAKGESMDKAGAYGAQGAGAYFIRKISGSYTNVVGLPMAELCEHLKNFGIEL